MHLLLSNLDGHRKVRVRGKITVLREGTKNIWPEEILLIGFVHFG